MIRPAPMIIGMHPRPPAGSLPALAAPIIPPVMRTAPMVKTTIGCVQPDVAS